MEEELRPRNKDVKTLIFIVVLCFVCGLLLSLAAFLLNKPQKEAKEFDQSKQMLIAAKILTHDEYFIILQTDGEIVPAFFDPQKKILIPISKDNQESLKASAEAIKQLSQLRIRPLLTDDQGHVYTLSEKQIDLSVYLEEHKKEGCAKCALKLFYAILNNDEKNENITDAAVAQDFSHIYAFVFPVSGFGLWAPIYGYLALQPDGETVIGTTWYDQAETPGLGANIAQPVWQNNFFKKIIFQPSSDGQIDLLTSPLGIIVVKGRVQDVYGNSPKSKNAVDGISGATLTGDGVTNAYRDSLTPYRNFLIKLTEKQS